MNFDLNIHNYKLNELIDMFDLPNNYDKNIIEANNLINSIELNGRVI